MKHNLGSYIFKRDKVLSALFALVIWLATSTVSFAGTNNYVYLVGWAGDIVKYDVASDKAVLAVNLGDAEMWNILGGSARINPKTMVLYAMEPSPDADPNNEDDTSSADPNNEDDTSSTFFAVELPGGEYVNSISFPSSPWLFWSSDMSKLILQYNHCLEPEDENGDCPLEYVTAVYNASTLEPIKIFKGIKGEKYGKRLPAGAMFANDGFTAYGENDSNIEVYKLKIDDAGIIMEDISNKVEMYAMLGEGKSNELRSKYPNRIIYNDRTFEERMDDHMKVKYLHQGPLGKGVLLYADIEKAELATAVIYDVPNFAKAHLSKDGTRIYLSVYNEVMDGNTILSKKTTGDVFIYNAQTGELIKKVKVDGMAGIEIISGSKLVRECSSSNGEKNIYNKFEKTSDGEMYYRLYLVDYSTEPYMKPINIDYENFEFSGLTHCIFVDN